MHPTRPPDIETVETVDSEMGFLERTRKIGL